MTAAIIFLILIGLLVFGLSVPVALGATSLVSLFFFSDFSLTSAPILGMRIADAMQDHVLGAIVLFLFYGRLCAGMEIRNRFATSFSALFGGRRIAATIGEILASLIQPDTAGDALLQRNDDAAATVNRLRMAGTAGWSALGQAAGLACLRVVMPPGIVLIILAFVFEESVFRLFEQMLPWALIAAALILLLAIPAGRIPVSQRGTKLKIEWLSFLWVLAPIWILGLIGAGILTPAEAAAFAVAFALILGALLRQLSGRILLRAVQDSLYDIGAIFLVIVFASVLSFALTYEGFPMMLGDWSEVAGPPAALAGILVLTFVTSAITGLLVTLFVVGPLALLAILAVGIDPIDFTIAFALVATLGLLMPPVGAIFATLAVGTLESMRRTITGVIYFSLPIAIVIALALWG
ncbi:MAG: TRAP transporter large permease subunit [Hyphomicrobiales bacterium]|nr:TRAP transporter large permease subunit [Hyphomicrobiales bacterium]